jgi:hypothetical protein
MKWQIGCGADDCKEGTYDIFDENGDNIAREVTYANAAIIVELHNDSWLGSPADAKGEGDAKISSRKV